jgi:hypothetical protein
MSLFCPATRGALPRENAAFEGMNNPAVSSEVSHPLRRASGNRIPLCVRVVKRKFILPAGVILLHNAHPQKKFAGENSRLPIKLVTPTKYAITSPTIAFFANFVKQNKENHKNFARPLLAMGVLH